MTTHTCGVLIYIVVAEKQRDAQAVLQPPRALCIRDIPRVQAYVSGVLLYTLVRHLMKYRSEKKDTLPPLNDAQITKLKHLSLVSSSMQSRVRHLVQRPTATHA